jgi:methylmalonyl-CoA mutase C-terminal domain/subunit
MLELLRNEGLNEVLVIGGGIMPDDDIKALEAQGVHKLFGPGTPTSAPIDFVRDYLAQRESGAAQRS